MLDEKKILFNSNVSKPSIKRTFFFECLSSIFFEVYKLFRISNYVKTGGECWKSTRPSYFIFSSKTSRSQSRRNLTHNGGYIKKERGTKIKTGFVIEWSGKFIRRDVSIYLYPRPVYIVHNWTRWKCEINILKRLLFARSCACIIIVRMKTLSQALLAKSFFSYNMRIIIARFVYWNYFVVSNWRLNQIWS